VNFGSELHDKYVYSTGHSKMARVVTVRKFDATSEQNQSLLLVSQTHTLAARRRAFSARQQMDARMLG
jgi:hypothetical protein